MLFFRIGKMEKGSEFTDAYAVYTTFESWKTLFLYSVDFGMAE